MSTKAKPYGSAERLKIANIFHTVDGEVSFNGPWHWTTFVRTGGCNLRCWKSSGYCDAPASLDMNRKWPEYTIEEIIQKVKANEPSRRVTITGGEPLLQVKGVQHLAANLQMDGYIVTLETSGSIYVPRMDLDSINSVIADLKPPSTEMAKMNKQEVFEDLTHLDYIKVVISERSDYEWAIEYLSKIKTDAQIAFGARFGHLELSTVAAWIQQDRRFDIMLNMQTHKYVWPECNTLPVDSLVGLDYNLHNSLEH